MTTTAAAHPSPSAQPPRDVSIAIVKASQREHVLSRLWPEFVKAQKLKHADPTRASTAALSLFVARMVAGEVGGEGGSAGGSAGGNCDGGGAASVAASYTATAEAASRLARRHLGVAEQLAAEKKVAKAAVPKAAAATQKAAKAKAVEEEEEEEKAPSAEETDKDASFSTPSSALAAAVRSLVASTLAHPRSKELYGSFPVTSRGWRRLPRVYGEKSGANGCGAAAAGAAGAAAGAASSSSSASPSSLPPALVAIDCEMVETQGGRQTDLARVAVAASIPLCWFEGDEEEGQEGEEAKKDDENGNGDRDDGEEEAKKEANGDALPSPPAAPKQLLLSPHEAAALSLKKAGYGPPHLVLSCAVAPPPSRPVSDWRSHITGLTRCSLSAAPMGRSEAQRAVAAAVARASGCGGWGEEDKGRESLTPEPESEPQQEAAAGGSLRPLRPPLPAPAVLVGHALHHDLQALRLDAAGGQLVIDTALLYGYEGLPRATPGLADLYSAVVVGGKKNPSLDDDDDDDDDDDKSSSAAVAPLRVPGAPHDCAADAVAALALAAEALAARVRGGKGKGKESKEEARNERITVPAPARKVERGELCRLLVHGLKPPSASSGFDAAAAVTALFETMPAGVARPLSVEAVAAPAAAAAEKKEGGGGTAKDKPASAAVATKAWAIFSTPAEADAAFAALPLPTPGSPSSASVATDSLGRPQRLARIPAAGNGESNSSSLPSSSSSQVVRVRKAAAHAGMSHGKFKPAKRDRSAASVRHGREQKMRRKS